jgi:hypothetical protein
MPGNFVASVMGSKRIESILRKLSNEDRRAKTEPLPRFRVWYMREIRRAPQSKLHVRAAIDLVHVFVVFVHIIDKEEDVAAQAAVPLEANVHRSVWAHNRAIRRLEPQCDASR